MNHNPQPGMAFQVVVARREDASRIAEIHMAAFASNLMLQAQFPTPPIRQALQQTLELKAEADIDDPYQTVLLVLEAQPEDASRAAHAKPTQGHKAIAYAKWSHPVPPGEVYVEPPWHWPEGTDFDMLEVWNNKMEEAQSMALGSNPCYKLTFLATDPGYQRQGAGSLLLQWGMKESAQAGVPIYVESTLEAADLYKKNGFKEKRSFSVKFWSSENQSLQEYTEVSFVYRPRATACILL
ncbi:hypothetical protein IL306_000945 [Fusarium sp. DS 682]|nr:hypothetical protein IL306_000945 [Fusarium sp. DS 682]